MSSSPPVTQEQVEPEESQPQKAPNLYHDVFGGEDSDLSSDEEDQGDVAVGGQPSRGGRRSSGSASPSPPLITSRAGGKAGSDDDEEDAESDEDSDDARDDFRIAGRGPSAELELDISSGDENDGEGYKPEGGKKSKKGGKSKKRDRRGSSDGEGDGIPRPKASKKKRDTTDGGVKKKRKLKETTVREGLEGEGEEGIEARSEDEEEPQDEASIKRRELENRIEAIGKGGKKKKRGKKADGDDLENQADETVAQVYNQMIKAVQEDIQLNIEKRSAVQKIRMLERVMGVMQNVTMQQSILDSQDFLQGIRQFLEPLRDGSLPSLTIQRSLLDQLKKMDITKEILKESGLGKIISFYTKSKRVQPDIARSANLLYDKWSRLFLSQSQVSSSSNNNNDHRSQQNNNGYSIGNGGGGGDVDMEVDDDDDRDDGRQQKRRKRDLGAELLKRQVDGRWDGEDQATQRSSRLPSQIGHAYDYAPAPIKRRGNQEDQKAMDARMKEQEKLQKFKRKAMLAKAGR